MQVVGLTMIFHCSYFQLFICFFVPYRYHRLMVRKYVSKREKFQVAKQWAADEGRSVWEME